MKKFMNGFRKFLVFMTLGALLLSSLSACGKKQVVEESAGTSSIPEEVVDPNAMKYNGKLYTKKENIETILIMGIDEFSEFANSLEGYHYTNSEQSDLNLLMIIDKDTQEITPFQINRDTMCVIDILNQTGDPVDYFNGQLCLAHAYGSGYKDSCRNQVRAVSRLLYDIDIDHYLALTMDAIPVLNDLVGGVTVTIEDDLTPNDATLKQGETVTLMGDQALTFVRARMSVADGTNINRMNRQRVYMNALYSKLVSSIKNDNSFAMKTVLALSDYLLSDMTTNQLSETADSFINYKVTEFETVEGTADYSVDPTEFYADEDLLYDQVIRLFYNLKES